MKRIYEDAAYETPQSCWWDTTLALPVIPSLKSDTTCDVAIIGGGFTGLNAAFKLSASGAKTVVIDAEQPGWGASGRNGGFCCLGGAKASSATLARRFGNSQRSDWHDTERAAVDHVASLLANHKIDADTHSHGETLLAHSQKAMQALSSEAFEIADRYNVSPQVFQQSELRQLGLNGAFYGGMTVPIGFALNPRKYHAGLMQAAQNAGARLYGKSPVHQLERSGGAWQLCTPNARVRAQTVILATNGYSSDDLPDWLRARYLPVQSSIIVTRPISRNEQSDQGWTSAQMSYDTRQLLHYFRLMPDGRFIFGMRGGLTARPQAQTRLSRKIRADFRAMFPAWRNVEISHEWSGLLCLTRNLTPFCGPVPGHPGLFAALGFHGNGVAMGSYLGAQLADIALSGAATGPMPAFLRHPPKRFPFGPFRRMLLAPAYAAAAVMDR